MPYVQLQDCEEFFDIWHCMLFVAIFFALSMASSMVEIWLLPYSLYFCSACNL